MEGLLASDSGQERARSAPSGGLRRRSGTGASHPYSSTASGHNSAGSPLLRISGPHATAQELRLASNAAVHKWWGDASVGSMIAHDSKLPSMARSGGSDATSVLSAPPPVEMTLAKPSVSYRKTINTVDNYGRPMAVAAQHYAVLVTDVEEWPSDDEELLGLAAEAEPSAVLEPPAQLDAA
jgi:hypothetical protein